MNVSTKQEQIAAMAERYPDRGLTSLNKHLDEEWLRAAFAGLRKDGAAGVDGISAKAYGEELDERLPELVNRAKSGSYRAPPVRRVYIDKPGKREKRPLGIPTTEDKLLQKAVTMLLEPIYEREFYDFSYGFRPGRGCHDALGHIWNSIMGTRTGWIVEADIRNFFSALPHDKLREILRQRVRDGVITRLIDKWLKAGVLEAGEWQRSENGTPQGGVISPLLSNVFLHEVLDKWFAEQIQPLLKGGSFLVRYADDFVMGFEDRREAERVLSTLWKRFARFGLELHPEKTRLVPFGKPRRDESLKDRAHSGSFDFLGFTHYWAQSRKGNWIVKRHTAKDRLNRSLKKIHQWCRTHRHKPLEVQHIRLCRIMNGHYGYYGVTGNIRKLHAYAHGVKDIWHNWLLRRHRRRDRRDWEWYHRAVSPNYPLPTPKIVHSVYRRANP